MLNSNNEIHCSFFVLSVSHLSVCRIIKSKTRIENDAPNVRTIPNITQQSEQSHSHTCPYMVMCYVHEWKQVQYKHYFCCCCGLPHRNVCVCKLNFLHIHTHFCTEKRYTCRVFLHIMCIYVCVALKLYNRSVCARKKSIRTEIWPLSW